MSELRLESLWKSFNDVPVLKDFSLQLAGGECVCLLGPSGCGKSTTLNVTAGFLKADSGRVIIGNDDVTNYPPNLRDSAIVFQSYALFPHMTVEKNIGYGLRARRVSATKIQSRVSEFLELLGLAELRDRYPGQLSGGQQQRVALARALAVSPRLLLLDEPLSNLDANLRRSIRDDIRGLQQKIGQTALWVTHDQSEAMAVADRVVVLNQGVVEQIDTPIGLWEKPRTVFTARFMGVENIFEGEDLVALASVARAGLSLGDEFECAMGVRPDRLDIEIVSDANMGGSPATAVFFGSVIQSVYEGGTVKYKVALDGTSLQLVVELGADHRRYAVGDKVAVSASREDLLLLR